MRRLGATVFLGAFCALGLCVPLPADEAPSSYPPEIERIKSRGVLVVGMYTNDVIPFMFHDEEGNFVGHEVELSKRIAAALGVEVEFDRSATTFNGIIDLVAQNEVDLGISLISRTLVRAQKVLFSDPYIVLRPTLLMNRLTVSRYNVDLSDPIRSLGSVRIRVGEKRGTSYVNIAQSILPGAEIREYDEWDQAMSAVLRGEVDAALRDEIGVKNYIAAFPEASIQMQMIALEDKEYADPLAVAIPPQSVHLLHWINLFFAKNGVTGNADNLLSQYARYYE
jgi:polar amino acid transport system substrate-binding protein